MIKISRVLAATAAVIALASCGSDDNTDTAADAVVASSEAPTTAAPETTAAPTTAAPTTVAPTTAAPETADASESVSAGANQIVITAPGLFPEGLTYDPVGDQFVVGSLWTGQVLAVGNDGTSTPFTESPGANLTGVEADHVGGRLLVAVTAVPSGTAMLSVHDLNSGEQLELIDFATVNPDAAFANGIAVDSNGNVYVTDTGAATIYKVDTAYEASIFAQHESFAPVSSGMMASGLNGIVAIDGALIVGHAPTGQLLRVPMDDPTNVSPIPTGVDGMAIDGMHLSDDGSSLAVVSNLGAVHLFESSDAWGTASESGRFDVGDSFPTSVTDRDGVFYVLQAHLDKLPDPSVEQYEILPVVVN